MVEHKMPDTLEVLVQLYQKIICLYVTSYVLKRDCE